MPFVMISHLCDSRIIVKRNQPSTREKIGTLNYGSTNHIRNSKAFPEYWEWLAGRASRAEPPSPECAHTRNARTSRRPGSHPAASTCAPAAMQGATPMERRALEIAVKGELAWLSLFANNFASIDMHLLRTSTFMTIAATPPKGYLHPSYFESLGMYVCM